MEKRGVGRPTDNPRGERLGFRVSEEESEMIQYCMEKLGISKSDLLRLGIRKIYEETKESSR